MIIVKAFIEIEEVLGKVFSVASSKQVELK
jgi:hypothetical protein